MWSHCCKDSSMLCSRLLQGDWISAIICKIFKIAKFNPVNGLDEII